MRRISCAVCAFLWLIACSYGEVIDKIVAVVEGRIITLSDVRQDREIRARLGEKPVDDDKMLIRQMIEDRLIEAQIAAFPGVEVTDAEIDPNLPDVLREAVRRRIRMTRYFDVRFRQFLRASDEELQKYYDEVFVPEARAKGMNPVPPLEQMKEAIRSNVIDEKFVHEVNNWLEAIRRRSNIEVFD